MPYVMLNSILPWLSQGKEKKKNKEEGKLLFQLKGSGVWWLPAHSQRPGSNIEQLFQHLNWLYLFVPVSSSVK